MVDNAKETVFSKHKRTAVHENSQRMRQWGQVIHVQTKPDLKLSRESRHKVLPLKPQAVCDWYLCTITCVTHRRWGITPSIIGQLSFINSTYVSPVKMPSNMWNRNTEYALYRGQASWCSQGTKQSLNFKLYFGPTAFIFSFFSFGNYICLVRKVIFYGKF